jgi:hypothetical protein
MQHIVLEKAKKKSNYTFLIRDTGVAIDVARRLADDGNRVIYYTEWMELKPKFARYAVGLGYPGIEKPKEKFITLLDEADCLVFYDTGYGDMIQGFRDKGYTVFGSGAGEILEVNRGYAKAVQRQVGLPVQGYRIINGIDNVLNYIKKNPKKYVKINIFRGDRETFYAEDAKSAEATLNVLRPKLGPFEASFEFLVEDKIPDVVVETGFDLFFNGHDYLRPYMWGYLKEGVYVGKFTNELPEMIDTVAQAMKPIFTQFNYRGMISCEILVTKDRKFYLLDWTCRGPYPMGALYTYAIKNYTDVIIGCARGEDVKIETRATFVGAMDAKSSHATENWIKVSYPPEFVNQIRVQGAKFEDEEHAPPMGDPIFAEIITAKNSIDAVIDDLNKLASEITATDYEGAEADDRKLKKIIKDGESVGLKF